MKNSIWMLVAMLASWTLIALLNGACGSDKTEHVKAPAPRNLGQVFVDKYMVEKFHILDKPVCEPWESSTDPGGMQSVLCSVGELLAVYCHGGGGKAPACELVIDKRQPAVPAPASAITEAAHEAAKQRAQPKPIPVQPRPLIAPKK